MTNPEPLDIKIEFVGMTEHGLLFYPDATYRMSKQECLKLADQIFKAFVPTRPGSSTMNDEEVRLKFFELIRENNALRDKVDSLEALLNDERL